MSAVRRVAEISNRALSGRLNASLHQLKVGTEKLLVTCSTGIEPLLRQELSAFHIGKSLTLQDGGILVDGESGDLCKASLLSRLADRIFICVGESPRPFTSMRELFYFCSSLPWEQYLTYTAATDLPLIKVASPQHSGSSKLPIVKVITEALLMHKKRVLERQGDSPELSLPIDEMRETRRLPMLRFHVLRHGGFQMFIDASHFLGFRYWRSSESRLRDTQKTADIPRTQRLRSTSFGSPARLLDTQAAAIILGTSLFQRFDDIPSNETCVVWDPFCSSGSFLLELMAMLAGQLPRSPRYAFPFTQFPCHEDELYQTVSRRLRLVSHDAWQKVKFFGSNGLFGSLETHEEAQSNFVQFLSTISHHSPVIADTLRANSRFVPAVTRYDHITQLAPKRCVIVTALPYASARGQRDLHKKFGAFLRQQRSVETVVIAAAIDSGFKDLSGIPWVSQFKFNSGCPELHGGPTMEVLQWTPKRG